MPPFAGIPFAGKPTQGVADTHNGARNKPNEDRFITFIGPGDSSPQTLFLVVADGVTSTHGGERASDIAVRILRDQLQQPAAGNGRPARSLRDRMAEAIHAANQSILETARKDPDLKGMSTTLVVAAVDGDQLSLMHLGDSRAYLIRDGKAHQLSRDHTWVQEALEEGRITPEQAANHPNKHVILRYLGDTRGLSIDQSILIPDKPVVDIDKTEVSGQMARSAEATLRLRAGDALLLCSDGLYNRITDAEIAAVVTNQPPDKAVSWLINEAVRRQEPDNITVVLWTTTEVKAAAMATKVRRPALLLAAAGALLAILAFLLLSQGGNPPNPVETATAPAAVAAAGVDETPTSAPVVETPTVDPSAAIPAAHDDNTTAAATSGDTTEEPLPIGTNETGDAPPSPGGEGLSSSTAVQQDEPTSTSSTPFLDPTATKIFDGIYPPADEKTPTPLVEEREEVNPVEPDQTVTPPLPAPQSAVIGRESVPTLTSTLRPTSTSLPTATKMPSATPTPSRTPTATPVPTATGQAPAGAPTTAPSAGTSQQGGPTSATIELPSDGAASNSSTRFKWTVNAPLAEGQGFEVLFWRPGEDAERDGKPVQGAATSTDVTLPINALAQGGYEWGVWLVLMPPKYDRVRMLAGPFTFTVSSSGGGTGSRPGPNPPDPNPPEPPPK